MKLLLTAALALTTLSACSLTEQNRANLQSAGISAGKAILRLGVGYLNARYGTPEFRTGRVQLREDGFRK